MAVPRPRLRLIRFHGVLAPNAKMRALVVPQGGIRALRQPSPPSARRTVRTTGRCGWVGLSCSNASSTTVSTAARTDELTSAVRITHPFHPRCGEAIDVVAQRVQWGEARVFCRDLQGLRSSLPARWTSLAPEDPYLAVGAGGSRFRVQDLIDLAVLLAGLR